MFNWKDTDPDRDRKSLQGLNKEEIKQAVLDAAIDTIGSIAVSTMELTKDFNKFEGDFLDEESGIKYKILISRKE